MKQINIDPINTSEEPDFSNLEEKFAKFSIEEIKNHIAKCNAAFENKEEDIGAMIYASTAKPLLEMILSNRKKNAEKVVNAKNEVPNIEEKVLKVVYE